ncbi:uncharacterized protein LOC105439270 [Strongylocentrotus purpuratus]|uniref:EGF-like domain-containing protein n=1 Tax=Strongylocentrotus purpuratus TaxID=7668 RepID=A0A7M7NP34_STRPU|nr:uncharacterized protein LOC105439270 [Strongylocentrotus purpuratus]
MFQKCKMMRLKDGSMVQSIPKLIPFPSVIGGCHQRKSKEGIPGGHRICRIPYCDENLCNNGWCEETMVGYNCTCSSGFQGRHCDEMIIQSTTEATTKPTMSPTTTISERSDTTTSQSTTTTIGDNESENQVRDEPYGHYAGTIRRNDITRARNHNLKVSRIINYGRDDQGHDEFYDHDVRHNDIARHHHLQVSRIIDYGRGDQDGYEAYDHGVSHNDIARNHRYQ